MSLKDRFSEELRYLHELGNDFATDNPQLARLLGKGGSDPDVERLMEAFAFLTAKLRLKLEDDLPELTHPMLQLLWPNCGPCQAPRSSSSRHSSKRSANHTAFPRAHRCSPGPWMACLVYFVRARPWTSTRSRSNRSALPRRSTVR